MTIDTRRWPAVGTKVKLSWSSVTVPVRAYRNCKVNRLLRRLLEKDRRNHDFMQRELGMQQGIAPCIIVGCRLADCPPRPK